MIQTQNFGSSFFSKNKFVIKNNHGETLEEAGSPERAEHLYIQNFNEIDSHIRKAGKDHKLSDPDIFANYAKALVHISANLCAQMTLKKSEEEQQNLLARAKSYVLRAKKTSGKYLNPNRINLKEYFEHFTNFLNNGERITRKTSTGEPLEAMIYRNRPEAENINEEKEVFLSQKEVLEKREELAKRITERIAIGGESGFEDPSSVEALEEIFKPKTQAKTKENTYSVRTADMFDKYKDLSHQAINNTLNSLTPNNEVNLNSAKILLGNTLSFLNTKDSVQNYWHQDEFALVKARISESEGRNKTPQIDKDVLESFSAMTMEEKPSINKQISHLETLSKAPLYLGIVTFFCTDEKVSKYAVSLLGKSKEQEAKHQLQKISQTHPSETIKEFAKSHLRKLK